MEKEVKKHRRYGRRKRNGNKIWVVLIIVCLLVITFCIYQLLAIFLEYKAGTDEYDELKQYVLAEVPEDREGVTLVTPQQMDRIAFEPLKGINEDTIGWIEIPGTKISYPVVQGADNVYYLNHTFAGEVNSAGSIFMETLNTPDFSDYHTLLYGHNMKNDSMFGSLSEYKSPSYLMEHPYIYLDAEGKSYIYQIFSCYETTSDSDSYTIGFQPDEIYEEFLNTIKGRSLYDTGVGVTKEDRVLTLSTCTSRGNAYRFVVHAKQM